MTRDDLLAHVRPLAEELAKELAALLWDRLEAQLDDALDAARSALASDLALPFVTRADARIAAAAPAAELEPASVPARAAPRPERAAPQGLSTLRTPGIPACSKCGQPGHNARSCGREPKGNRSAPSEPMTAIAPERPPGRYNEIEIAAAKRRIAAKQTAPVAAPKVVRPKPAAILPTPIEGVLPMPTYSCTFDTSRGRDPERSMGDE